MLQLTNAILLSLCLLCVGLVFYLLRDLKNTRARRRQIEDELNALRGERESVHKTFEPQESKQLNDANAGHDDARQTDDAAAMTLGSIDPHRTEEPSAAHVADTVDETDIYALAWNINDYFERSSFPKELLHHARFIKGVKLLCSERYTDYDLLAYAQGSQPVVGCMALEALSIRPNDDYVADSVLDLLNELRQWPRYYALRALRERAKRPLLAHVLVRLDSTWREFVSLQSLREFVSELASRGETVTSAELLDLVTRDNLDESRLADLKNVVSDLGSLLSPDIIIELGKLQNEQVDLTFLKSFGRVWAAADASQSADGGEDEIVLLDAVKERVNELEAAIRREIARSVLLVGDSGVGKTTLVRALAVRLQAERWTIIEASAADVLAGQQYIGQLEERVQTIIRQMGGKRVLWVIPNFQETLWAGRHKYSPTGLLDLLLPHIESGKLKVIGEVPSASFEQLARLRPKLRTAMQTCRVAPLDDADTLELARRWAARHAASSATIVQQNPDEKASSSITVVPPRISEQTLREAFQLARQYLGDKAAPGNLLVLLDTTHRRLAAAAASRATSAVTNVAPQITLDDVLNTLSQLTGLPSSILDEREGLDLSELHTFFNRRVLGQPEAVECLVERVAMIKAGLTDPTRPQGVFLFVGPTGTGKTEIAKTLAQFLFGTHERMIRLDMSEFMTAESLERILGDTSETGEGSGSAALVNQIRKQPFSVVLLDEFEKAHPQVWDLFLQVFDDGRLTDRRGSTADFRHCVIIMTSNLGATLPTGASIGFSQEHAAQFASAGVERAVSKTFRREFVNRIDRIVVFRPLALGVMRDLLRKELSDVLQRRGFRTRQWAVEWDESAIEFLLHKGFTADLGARPLKRAIERYLLSPLSLTIVNHQFPEGDQFLFVRSSADNSALDVQFVDPDAPEQATNSLLPISPPSEEDTPSSAARALRLESIALDARGAVDEVRVLQNKFDALAAEVNNDAWRARKTGALQQTQTPDFWNSPARFSVLGLAEYMDRIEAGLDTAGSLIHRLSGTNATATPTTTDGQHERKTFPPDLVARLAEQLYLLDAAARALADGEPHSDAFVSVRAVRETGADVSHDGDDFARRICEMYQRWAEKRRMRLVVLKESAEETSRTRGHNNAREGGDSAGDGNNSTQEYRALLAVSGFGAYSILLPEAGLHVYESPQDEKSFTRARVEVRVVAQPDEPAGHTPDALRRQAELTLAAQHDNNSNAPLANVVRRYREQPSPLVRDTARGWRTGKIERVFGGDFDLMF